MNDSTYRPAEEVHNGSFFMANFQGDITNTNSVSLTALALSYGHLAISTSRLLNWYDTAEATTIVDKHNNFTAIMSRYNTGMYLPLYFNDDILGDYVVSKKDTSRYFAFNTLSSGSSVSTNAIDSFDALGY